MSDLTVDLIVTFEERFNRLGHDLRIVTVQTGDNGESVLRCVQCEGLVSIRTDEKRTVWSSRRTRLDETCRA